MILKFKIALPTDPDRPSNIVKNVLKVKVGNKDLADVETKVGQTEVVDETFGGNVGDAVHVAFYHQDVGGGLWLVRAFDATLAKPSQAFTAGDMGLVVL